MNKIKITDIAKEFEMTSVDLISKLQEEGFKISSRSRTLTEAEAEGIRTRWREKKVSLTETRKGDVLEKRVKTSVIRRRKVQSAEPAQAGLAKLLESLPPKSAEGVKPTPETVGKSALEMPEISEKVPGGVSPGKKIAETSLERVKEKDKPVSKVKIIMPPPAVSLPPKVGVPSEAKPQESKISKVPTEIEIAEAKKEKKKKEELELELDELAKKRKKAFIKKRATEFDLTDFSRIERIYQPKKKRVLDKTRMKQTSVTTPKASKRVIKVLETVLVSDLAENLKVKVSEVIKKLIKQGMMVTANQRIDADTATLIASEYGYEIKAEAITEENLLVREKPSLQDLKPRPPVITVMGHVDHGKTTLLDAIRKTNVAEGEAGGITQHIGAYRVNLGSDRSMTFIDTPGHEAFSAMRSRGAKTTDIVILVISADDGIMPQTREAVAHAKAAGVPIIVAINKIDKPGAQVDKIKKDLTELDLVPEEWGGTTIVAEVSAKTQKGVKELLEMIMLQADVLEIKASVNTPAEGVVLEAKLEKGLGPVATVLVQQGILKRGDSVVMGEAFGKVRLMLDDRGQSLTEAGPSFAVEISGLNTVPEAGEPFYAFRNEQEAERLVEWRLKKSEEAKIVPAEKVTLEGIYEKMKEASLNELKFLVKADVKGSLEVIEQTIQKLSDEKIKMNVIYSAAGGISESDVNLAYASNAILIGFNIRPDRNAMELIKKHKVDVRIYTIIYDLIDDLKKAMLGRLEPTFKETVMGRAEVRNIFNVSKVGTIAGCMVIEGKMVRTAQLRLLRDHKIVHTGKTAALKRFKNDVKEVAQGYECGISFENYNDIKVGDLIEAFVIEEVRPTS